jgi:hypothetical protein
MNGSAKLSVVRRIAAILLVPFVLITGIGSARALYRCGHDSVLRAMCCCPAPRPTKDASVQPRCCKMEQVHTTAPEPRAGSEQQVAFATAPVRLPVAAITPPAPVVRAATPRSPDPFSLLEQRTSFRL